MFYICIVSIYTYINVKKYQTTNINKNLVKKNCQFIINHFVNKIKNYSNNEKFLLFIHGKYLLFSIYNIDENMNKQSPRDRFFCLFKFIISQIILFN